MNQRGLRELSINQPDFSISLSTTTAVPVAEAAAAPTMAMPAVAAPLATPAPVAPAAPKGYTIASPLIGIFYRSSSPDQPTFVEVGDTVEVGQIIGIIEAMKVFNEITADRAGTVVAIPAENGKLVQVDQPLVILSPEE